jgi:hypothetical protein
MAKKTKKVRKRMSVKPHTRTSKSGKKYQVKGHIRAYMARLKERRQMARAARAATPAAARLGVGDRDGQSKHYGPKEARAYMKAGKVHVYDPKLDASIKAKRKRKRTDAPWRGDLPGKRI